MSLSPSCDNLYFPAEPLDNIITLKWNSNDTPLEPNTSVIFKVKCTAPQLFHVVPRYGALLLADATGASVQYSNKATEISFGLRENHAEAEGEDAHNGNGAHGASPSAINRASAARGSRASSAAPGGPAYQERFAVEYVMIKSEPLAFQQILNSLADHGKLTEVVKSMWSLVASGAIPRAHLGVQASINMKVFMENVVRNRSDPAPNGGDEATKIIVPTEARLVAPSSHERASHPNAHNPSTANSHKTSENGSATNNNTPTSSRRKAVDELRALKEEINLMRRDSGASHSGSPQNQTSPTAATTPNAKSAADARRLVGALSPQKNTAALPLAPGDDVMMKFDCDGDGARTASGAKKQKGLKVYMVLAMMFVLYIFLLIMRRGARHTIEASAEASNAPNNNAFAVQVSSRELEKTS